MILLKDVTIKNFLSVGQVTQHISLERSDLTLILGENLDLGGDGNRNGTGKTSVLQAISYALFGIPINSIRKDNLVNRTNGKDMLVTLTFSVNNTEYKIERGRKPNILKFYVNNVQQKITEDQQGENKSTQETIEKILNITPELFNHIVALNTYSTPFLALKNNEQRDIIEQLLGITLLSEKAEIIKDLIRQSKDDIQLEEFRIKGIEEANKRVKEQIDALKRRQKIYSTKHAEDLALLTKEYEQLIEIDINVELQSHKDLAIYNEQLRLKNEHDALVTNVEKDIVKEEKTKEKLESEIKTLKKHKCYACGQDFHDEKYTTTLKDKTDSLAESVLSLKNLKNELKKLKENSIAVPSKPKTTHYKTEGEAIKHSSQLENLIKQLEQKVNEVDPYLEQISDMENKALQKTNFDKINELTNVLDHQKFLLDLLTNKDSFVRKKIIEQNLGYLNLRLTHYLDKIGLPHNVVFKNDLEVQITELGREMDFYNLSRGEMNRLILALSWSFRDVWENLYSPINVMFVDELIDSGLDTMGVENSMAILKDMARRRHKSVWLVSHREELAGRVPHVLKVVKEAGFTTYSSAADME